MVVAGLEMEGAAGVTEIEDVAVLDFESTDIVAFPLLDTTVLTTVTTGSISLMDTALDDTGVGVFSGNDFGAAVETGVAGLVVTAIGVGDAAFRRADDRVARVDIRVGVAATVFFDAASLEPLVGIAVDSLDVATEAVVVGVACAVVFTGSKLKYVFLFSGCETSFLEESGEVMAGLSFFSFITGPLFEGAAFFSNIGLCKLPDKAFAANIPSRATLFMEEAEATNALISAKTASGLIGPGSLWTISSGASLEGCSLSSTIAFGASGSAFGSSTLAGLSTFDVGLVRPSGVGLISSDSFSSLRSADLVKNIISFEAVFDTLLMNEPLPFDGSLSPFSDASGPPASSTLTSTSFSGFTSFGTEETRGSLDISTSCNADLSSFSS